MWVKLRLSKEHKFYLDEKQLNETKHPHALVYVHHTRVPHAPHTRVVLCSQHVEITGRVKWVTHGLCSQSGTSDTGSKSG